jgi:uncharacterized protein
MKKEFNKRSINLNKTNSFFLFGPRGSGKSTLVRERFSKNSCYLNLLDLELEEKFTKYPNELKNLVENLDKKTTHVIIDEIQKIPKLLDLVHLLIEDTNKKFILTGSSARKLKYGNANLLAGRAFVYHLHPYTSFEIPGYFDLKHALKWGMLPKIYSLSNDEEKKLFLQSYAQTYLREEIQIEQLVRKLNPFRNFLEIAAQMNGKIINFKKIARDIGVGDTTVKDYYSILEDTLIGFKLNAFNHSFRKQLSTKPKFYFFDTGITRALNKNLTSELEESSFAFGDAFEHFIILEAIKLATYNKYEYSFYYLRTKHDAEIDLVVKRPGEKILFIEIKSSKQVRDEDLTTYSKLIEDFGECEAVCFSRDEYTKTIKNITVYPWQEGLKKFFH